MSGLTWTTCPKCERTWGVPSEQAHGIAHFGQCLACILVGADKATREAEQEAGFRLTPCPLCFERPAEDCPRCHGTRHALETLDGKPLRHDGEPLSGE